MLKDACSTRLTVYVSIVETTKILLSLKCCTEDSRLIVVLRQPEMRNWYLDFDEYIFPQEKGCFLYAFKDSLLEEGKKKSPKIL